MVVFIGKLTPSWRVSGPNRGARCATKTGLSAGRRTVAGSQADVTTGLARQSAWPTGRAYSEHS